MYSFKHFYITILKINAEMFRSNQILDNDWSEKGKESHIFFIFFDRLLRAGAGRVVIGKKIAKKIILNHLKNWEKCK